MRRALALHGVVVGGGGTKSGNGGAFGGRAVAPPVSGGNPPQNLPGGELPAGAPLRPEPAASR
jgi:hypothetical protein